MIIAIVGPTGVGKTKMSVKLAKRYDAEIISCDSMQVYKKMDVGTAKVTEVEKEGVKHHLIDIKEVWEDYSVYDYQKDARLVLDSLINRGENVVIVGGTGLYLKALLYDYKFNEVTGRKDFSCYSNEELYNMVINIDKDTKIHVNNRQRLESFLNNHQEGKADLSQRLIYDAKIIGLTRPRDKLYEAIDKRVDQMVEAGLLAEAKQFYDAGINGKAINTAIGYKELYAYFDGKTSLIDAVNLIKQKSRNYAKRQYTWFNNQMDVKWFDVDEVSFDKTFNKVVSYVENK